MARPLRILTVVGARPQFIKAAAITRAIDGPFAGRIHQTLVHTGQHADPAMSEVFFGELGSHGPHHRLLGDGSDASRFGRMMAGVEAIITRSRPDVVLVYGDTTSTLAGAMAACRTGIPLAHVEAGLRSFDNTMPEEENRVLTDHVSTWLFCPTASAVAQLGREGITNTAGNSPGIREPHVSNTGDVMLDNTIHFTEMARARPLLDHLDLRHTTFAVATMHRAGTVDDRPTLMGILDAFGELYHRTGMQVIVPLHPRTRKTLGEPCADRPGVRLIDPVGYPDMLCLVDAARIVLTDSGGLQKEACFLGKRCVILRDRTEWLELLGSGGSTLVGTDRERIVEGALTALAAQGSVRPTAFGDGHAAEHICHALLDGA